MNRLLLAILATVFTHASADRIDQSTQGWCSPAVADVGGNVEVVCQGVDPRALARLNELLDKKDLELQDKMREAELWAKRYREVKTSLTHEAAIDERALKAKAYLQAGELGKAGALLDELLDEDGDIGLLKERMAQDGHVKLSSMLDNKESIKCFDYCRKEISLKRWREINKSHHCDMTFEEREVAKGLWSTLPGYTSLADAICILANY